MIKPMNGNALLKPIEEEEQMYGNIVIPDLGKETGKVYEVVGSSPTYNFNTDTNVESNLVIGQKVITPAFGGTKVNFENTEYVLIKDTEILGIYE